MNVADLKMLDGKSFGVLLITEKPGGPDEYAVFEGFADWDGSHLVIDRGKRTPPFTVPEETYDRIQPVDEKLRSIFRFAEYFVPLLVGPLPADADQSKFKATGIRWPQQDES